MMIVLTPPFIFHLIAEYPAYLDFLLRAALLCAFFSDFKRRSVDDSHSIYDRDRTAGEEADLFAAKLCLWAFFIACVASLHYFLPAMRIGELYELSNCDLVLGMFGLAMMNWHLRNRPPYKS